jgi:hypothetical protein
MKLLTPVPDVDDDAWHRLDTLEVLIGGCPCHCDFNAYGQISMFGGLSMEY